MRGPASRGARSFVYAPQDPQDRYQNLFSVTFRHNYYNRNQGLCPDFAVTPAPSSAALMASLGLLFRDDGTGFSVLFQQASLGRLTSYIRSQKQPPSAAPGYWTRLTFLLSMVSPLFVGITDIPIGTKPTRRTLYANNMQAHEESGTIVLSKGPFMGTASRCPVTGDDLTIVVPGDTKSITVSDISGAVVIPAADSSNPVPIPIYKLGQFSSASLNFAGLPYDLYTIAVQPGSGAQKRPHAYPRTLAYVPPSPVTMCMLDILLTQPTEGAPGFYPLTAPPNGRGFLRPSPDAAYVLPFNARNTYWEYYIVSRDPAAQLTDVRIEPLERDAINFLEQPDPGPLPDGSLPIVLRSETTLPLRQSPPERFRLTARRTDPSGRSNDILVSPLPVAPGAPVWPGPPRQSLTGTSEMFVYV
jgi:hypothetical protein